MPSGKKARGRKNRAKKEANLTAYQRSLWEQTIIRNNGASNSATPSCVAVLPRIPRDGLAVSLMNYLASEGLFNRGAKAHFGINPVEFTLEFPLQSIARFPGVLANESERSLAIDLLLRFVRNVFVHESALEGGDWFYQHRQIDVAICNMISVLELCGTFCDMKVARRRATKTSNMLRGGNRRDVVKFVAKRLPCTCLKKLHIAARKKLTKVGKCVACLRQFPRSQLYVCTGCMLAEYCSRECQRADWSHHKKGCDSPEVMSRCLPANYKLGGTAEINAGVSAISKWYTGQEETLRLYGIDGTRSQLSV